MALDPLKATVHGINGVVPRGIEITDLDSQATLWFSFNNGAHWQQVQSADWAGQVLLLQNDGATRVALAPVAGSSPDARGLAQALSFRAWSGTYAAGQNASNGVLVAAPAQTGPGTAFGDLLNSATLVVSEVGSVQEPDLLTSER